MDHKQILPALRQGLDLVDKLAPFAVLLGPQAAALAKVVDGLSDVSQTVLERVEEGAVVMTSQDQNEIRQINKRLAERNDELIKHINNT